MNSEELKLKYERLKPKYGNRLKLTKKNIKRSNKNNRFESLCENINCEYYKCYGKEKNGLCQRHYHIKSRNQEIINNEFFKEMNKELNEMEINKKENHRLLKLMEEIKLAWFVPLPKEHTLFEQRKEKNKILFKCITCSKYKTKKKFNIAKNDFGICASCKLCRRNEEKTLFGHMSSLVRYVKKSKKGTDGTISRHYLLKMLWKQKGLCYISGHKLSLVSGKISMQISIERKK